MNERNRNTDQQLDSDKDSNFVATDSSTEVTQEFGIPSIAFNVPIEDLGLGVRVYNALKRTGITNVGEVMQLITANPETLSSIRRFGELALDELIKQLQVKGFWEPSDEIHPTTQQNEGITNEEFWGVGIFGTDIRLVSLDRTGHYQIVENSQKLDSILYVVTPESLALKAAIKELEDLMNDPEAKESSFQDFFERNPELILNDEYKRAHPHIVLTMEEGSLIPDFLLEPLGQSSLCDILDLKLPNSRIFVLKKSRMRYSAAVAEACAQLREYNNYFDDRENRDRIYNQYGLTAYKPKMIVVIGRRGKIDPITYRRIQADYPQLAVRTYDDIMDRAQAKLRKAP